MPPSRKYLKEDIIEVAYKIVEKEGFASVNARRIAKELGSSVQPIFHNFLNMEEVEREVYDKIYQKYKECMLVGRNEEKAYKQMGLSYIRFAKEYPEFFKVLFMQHTNYNAMDFVMADATLEEVIQAGQKLTGFTTKEQKHFHVKVWIFTHGIACLVATNTIQITDQEIEELLENTVREMARGYKERNL